MKKALMLAGLLLSLNLQAKNNNYHIEIQEVDQSWSKRFKINIDTENIIASDFSRNDDLAFPCKINDKQLQDTSEAMFSTEPELQDMTLHLTRVVNVSELKKDNCLSVAPIIDVITEKIGFPIMLYEKTIETGKGIYLLKVNKLR